ncbi:hypothetical protein CHUAL_003165 [Chamberlinius hualienensis]
MSRRVLRRLQSGQKHSIDLDNRGLSESDDTDLSPTHKPSCNSATGESPVNPFEVLERERTPSDEEAKEDDDVDDSEAGVGGCGDESKKHGGGQENDRSQATDSLKRKKKKKKKKQKEAKEEDVESVAQEVREMLGETEHQSAVITSSAASTTHSPVRNLLGVDYRHLQPDNEMRRIFGARVVQADAGKKRTRSRGHIKTTKLVSPKQNWPHVGKSGISMVLLEGREEPQFKFDHSPKYRQMQFQFLDAVESLNPDNIVAVVNTHPYHIDGLLQLSDIMRIGDDIQTATELVERALYCFESSFHPLFNIAQGNCRLDYRYDENRSFFIAIFKKLVYVGQKGCHRTALEFCKLLLALDPDSDPLCVTLMIDFYAIKSGEYAYLLQFYEELEPKKNLSQLPNFALSIALAKFYLSTKSTDDSSGKLRQEADKMLQNALIAFPASLKVLLDKCNIQPDKRVENHSFFGPNCSASHPSSLMSLIHLYVGRCWHLYKESEVMSWLEANVNAALDRVDKKDPAVNTSAEHRKVRYQGMPRNIYRHIMLSEIKDATATLPADMSRVTILSFDPLPPLDRISSYSRPQNANRRETDHNVLQSLFQSLFPNYVLAEPRQQVGGAEDGAAANQDIASDDGATASGDSTQDFRRSVTSLLDAMRDLLTNIHLPEVNQEGDADDSEDDDDDDVEEEAR